MSSQDRRCKRCKKPNRPLLWAIRRPPICGQPSADLYCNYCFEWMMEHQKVNLDNVVRLSDSMTDFDSAYVTPRRKSSGVAAASV